jgi:sugar O-acyltransferase (sialic acid O-acetyltransferase NeuD family)
MAYHVMREGIPLVAFTVDKEYITEDYLYDLPVLPFETIEKEFSADDHQMFIAVGPAKLNQLRSERCLDAEKLGYLLFSYVSRSAIVWDGLQVMQNCKIGERTICQPYSRIGKNVLIGSGCIIGHDTTVDDNCFIASGVMVGGNVTIGRNCFLGTGSVIRNDVSIADHCVIGAGVTLLESTTASSVYINTSAQKMPVTSDQVRY